LIQRLEAAGGGRRPAQGQRNFSAQMVLTIGNVGLNHKIEGTIELN
jgi:hypothetical protein